MGNRTIMLHVPKDWFEALDEFRLGYKFAPTKRDYIIEAVNAYVTSEGGAMPKVEKKVKPKSQPKKYNKKGKKNDTTI